MNIRFNLLLLSCLVVFIRLPICYGSGTNKISGFFFQETIDKPIPGALIALYDANENFLVDHTYTLDNGRFMLKAAKYEGSFYIVATKDFFSKRTENFKYNPQSTLMDISIQYQESRNTFLKIVDYIWEKLDNIINILVGLLIGLGFNFFVKRKKAKDDTKRYIYRIRESASNILSEYDEFEKMIQEKTFDNYKEIIDRMGKYIDELEKLLSIDNYIQVMEIPYFKGKKSAKKAYESLKKVVNCIKVFIEEKPNNVLIDPDRVERYLKGFKELQRELDNSKFLNPF